MSWIREPGEHVKLIRNKLADLKEKMEKKTQIVKLRHLEEINAIKNIFCEDRCLEYSEGHLDIELIFDIEPILPVKEIQLSYIYENANNVKIPIDFGSIFLQHLPSIRFYLKFPTTYPVEKPPEFTLDIFWLTPWEISRICGKLDELWIENKGTEILFIWIDFLKSNLFNFLEIHDKIDISFQFGFNKDKEDNFYKEIINLRDARVSKAICRCPVDFLVNYNKSKESQRFKRNVHFCEICIEQNTGDQCIMVKKCQHIFCKNCLEQYFNLRIKDGNVMNILCPKIDCTMEFEYDEIKKLCKKEIFLKFEELLLKKTINMMKDTVPCARKYCDYPVIRENLADNLATCAHCKYSFCVYCRKVYHGVSPCEMDNKEKEKLIADYEKASKSEKKLLESRHGKKQIQLVVERSLTHNYLKNNSKMCPNCLTQTSKIDGCNKMTCTYCQKNFCWLCGKIIETKNPYDHFSKMKSGPNSCGGRLFDGLIKEENFLDELEIQRNLEFFQLQN